MFEGVIVVDGRAHMLGRLASIVAKELLCGQPVVVVRTEQIVVSGSLVRNKVKYTQFLKKRTNTNPKKGPIHYRSPARMFWRTVRGMLPHKTFRGQQAMSRLQCFEGVPDPYDKMKKMVVPEALKVMRLKPFRRFCVLGRLASEFGWKHADLIEKLEAKRRVKSAEFYAKKKTDAHQRALAENEADLSAVLPKLEQFGHYIAPPEPVAA
mmetsp:Transcript_3986/g.10239  ORF Transcript_3986/g.10239 Transcript_3986/m.10239 type:complete len:209 (+) Transcript_3986:29-655(+)